MTGSFPSPVHEGHGKAVYYIDKHADDEQFDSLWAIVTGKAAWGPFEVCKISSMANKSSCTLFLNLLLNFHHKHNTQIHRFLNHI